MLIKGKIFYQKQHQNKKIQMNEIEKKRDNKHYSTQLSEKNITNNYYCNNNNNNYTSASRLQATPRFSIPSFSERFVRAPEIQQTGTKMTKQTPRFEFFFPEYLIELVTNYPSTTSSGTNIGIKMTDAEGDFVILKGESNLATHDLWHYFYNKSVQTTLPSYIKKREPSSRPGAKIQEKSRNYYLIEHEVTKEFELLEISLKNSAEVLQAAEKWLFDLNVDHLNYLAFERTSSLFLHQGMLLVCRSFKRIPSTAFLGRSFGLNSGDDGNQLKTLFGRIDRILLVFKNLEFRHVFFVDSSGFDFGDIAILDEEIYFSGIERLVMIPERQKYTERMLEIFLKKFCQLLEKTVQARCQKTQKLKNQFFSIFETLANLIEEGKGKEIKSLSDLVIYFRKNLKLDEGARFQGPSKPQKNFQEMKVERRLRLRGQNSLDINLSSPQNLDEKNESINHKSVFESLCEVGEEGEVLTSFRDAQRIRKISFKNKFFQKKQPGS